MINKFLYIEIKLKDGSFISLADFESILIHDTRKQIPFLDTTKKDIDAYLRDHYGNSNAGN